MVDMVSISLIITSDALYLKAEDDKVTPIVKMFAEKRGYKFRNARVPNNKLEIIKTVIEELNYSDILIVSGGTGVGPRDKSVEAVRTIIERELPGFGELVRRVSYEDVGVRAMLSRTFAGIIEDKVVFVTPGNPSAVRLILEKIISPVLDHLLEIVKGYSHWGKSRVYVVRGLTPEKLIELVRYAADVGRGANLFFIGKVKEVVSGRRVKYFRVDIDEDELRLIADRICEKYGVNLLAFVNSGLLRPNDIVTFIYVSTSTRKVAFDALEEIIDLFKQTGVHEDIYVD